MNFKICPVCEGPCKVNPSMISDGGNASYSSCINCLRCGEFNIGTREWANVSNYCETQSKRALLSSYIFQNQGLNIDKQIFESVKSMRIPAIAEQARRLLYQFARILPRPGDILEIHSELMRRIVTDSASAKNNGFELSDTEAGWAINFLTLFAAACISEVREFYFILNNYLINTKSYAALASSNYHGPDYIISGKGWEYIQDSDLNTDSLNAFVAMSFEQKHLPFFQQVIENDLSP